MQRHRFEALDQNEWRSDKRRRPLTHFCCNTSKAYCISSNAVLKASLNIFQISIKLMWNCQEICFKITHYNSMIAVFRQRVTCQLCYNSWIFYIKFNNFDTLSVENIDHLSDPQGLYIKGQNVTSANRLSLKIYLLLQKNDIDKYKVARNYNMMV